MRTTSTLDADVARLLAEERRYRVRPHETSLRPGIDALALDRLADELEDEAVLAKVGRKLPIR